jgi:Tfp pilus assembly protein PilF
LKGSLRLEGDALHLGWRLSRVRDGLLLWTHRTSIVRDELGSVLEKIIARVAGAVLPTLERDIDTGPIDAEATSGYSLYLQGRARILAAATITDMQEAADLFERSIALAPQLVNAQLSLARLYNTDFEQSLAGHDKGPLRRRAFELCSRAVNVDPRSAHARARLGWCYLRRGDLVHAESQFEEALSLSPYHADCLNEIGVAFGHMGKIDPAMALLSRAFEINPFPRDDYFCDMAVLQMLGGEHARAEANFEIAHNRALHYVAFRLANRGLMGKSADGALDDLRSRFRATWVRAAPPGDNDLLEAIFDYIPLQRHEHRAIVADGLSRLGLTARRS